MKTRLSSTRIPVSLALGGGDTPIADIGPGHISAPGKVQRIVAPAVSRVFSEKTT